MGAPRASPSTARGGFARLRVTFRLVPERVRGKGARCEAPVSEPSPAPPGGSPASSSSGCWASSTPWPSSSVSSSGSRFSAARASCRRRPSSTRGGRCFGTGPAVFLRLPTLFWLDASDAAFRAAGLVGLACGRAAPRVRQRAEPLLPLADLPVLRPRRPDLLRLRLGDPPAGDGFPRDLPGSALAARGPSRGALPLAGGDPAPAVARVSPHAGAGLIKLRGDPCWRDLTCLVFHYETQPNPNPLSWYLHQLPAWFHRLEVLFNHLVELVAPFFVFGPRPARLVAGGLLVLFQVLLILSGNLSFLNWLTLTVCVACLDDGAFRRLLPGALRERLDAAVAGAEETKAARSRLLRAGRRGRAPEPQSGREHALAGAGDEHLVRSLRAREHLRGLRQHRPRALRDRARGHGGRPAGSRRPLGRNTTSNASPGRPRAGPAGSLPTTTAWTGRCGSWPCRARRPIPGSSTSWRSCWRATPRPVASWPPGPSRRGRPAPSARATTAIG